MSSPRVRRKAIREILAAGPVRSQKELGAALRRAGHRVSQPALSRDLRALGVAKHAGQYEILGEATPTPLGALRPLLRAVGRASHLVVVRCEPGAASAVARALDAESLSGVVGSVAGDDTVFVALAGRSAARRFEHHVSEYL